MRIAYHLATPPAPLPSLDAAVQEVDALRAAFGGTLTQLYPAASYHAWVPRRWLLPSQVRRIVALDREVDLHHLVSDRLLPFPVLTQLRRPVIYRLLTSPERQPRGLAALSGPVVVSSVLEAERLRGWGAAKVEVIAPGIDLERFRRVKAPPAGPFTVMMASAPWTRRQFATKGVDALLEALSRRPAMRLILLWRGVLTEAAQRRIETAGLEKRVELIRRPVDVARVLGRVHIVVLATTSPRVVKAYPHSLLEGLAAGRPILTSPQLAIAEWIRARGGGEVVECAPDPLGSALDRLMADYEPYRAAARGLDLGRFSITTYVDSYHQLYQSLMSR
ncbi:MAG: glycosyltransferase [Acidobacteria bacterium]|nr:glycosyltransferase [Acidobacteriota bacterium]